MTQLADVIDQFQAVAKDVGEPFKDGIDLVDFPIATYRLIRGFMGVARTLPVVNGDKKRLVLEAFEETVSKYRDRIDVPWTPDWLDDKWEDAAIAKAGEWLEEIYDTVFKWVAPILGSN